MRGGIFKGVFPVCKDKDNTKTIAFKANISFH